MITLRRICVFVTLLVCCCEVFCKIHKFQQKYGKEKRKSASTAIVKRVLGMGKNCVVVPKTHKECKHYIFRGNAIDYCKYYQIEQCITLDKKSDSTRLAGQEDFVKRRKFQNQDNHLMVNDEGLWYTGRRTGKRTADLNDHTSFLDALHKHHHDMGKRKQVLGGRVDRANVDSRADEEVVIENLNEGYSYQEKSNRVKSRFENFVI